MEPSIMMMDGLECQIVKGEGGGCGRNLPKRRYFFWAVSYKGQLAEVGELEVCSELTKLCTWEK